MIRYNPCYESEYEARLALASLKRLLSDFKYVTLSNVRTLAYCAPHENDHFIGWKGKDLDNARIGFNYKRGVYYIDLPRPYLLD